MAKKSSTKALIGTGLAGLGLLIMLMATLSAAVAAFFAIFGIMFSGFDLGISISILIGIVLMVFGSKLFFENETVFIKNLIGVAGIILFFIGVGIFLSGGATAGSTLFGGIMLLSASGGMAVYAFPGLDFLGLAGKIIRIYKTVLGIKTK